MGSRGASSGVSIRGNKYGTQYKSILQFENIKFVKKTSRQSEDLMETMTPGRIYATVGGKDVIRITFFDEINKRNKVIEIDKKTQKWHVHHGYEHTEYSEEHHESLSDSDQIFLDKVLEVWHNKK
ncbi:MAG: hypothetical protein IJ899_20735 [Blautia sp.]|nr:hypothetical protein [Blautia sp.]